MRTALIALAIVVGSCSFSFAQAQETISFRILAEAPVKGRLKKDRVRFVRDKECGEGQLLLIIGGNNKIGRKRAEVCVTIDNGGFD